MRNTEITLDEIIDQIRHLHALSHRPRAEHIWAVLDRVGDITDEAKRICGYANARAQCNRDLKDLVVQHRALTQRRYETEKA